MDSHSEHWGGRHCGGCREWPWMPGPRLYGLVLSRTQSPLRGRYTGSLLITLKPGNPQRPALVVLRTLPARPAGTSASSCAQWGGAQPAWQWHSLLWLHTWEESWASRTGIPQGSRAGSSTHRIFLHPPTYVNLRLKKSLPSDHTVQWPQVQWRAPVLP